MVELGATYALRKGAYILNHGVIIVLAIAWVIAAILILEGRKHERSRDDVQGFRGEDYPGASADDRAVDTADTGETQRSGARNKRLDSEL